MKDTPKAPAKDPPEPSAFERMKDFTWRLIAVPKTEIKDERKRPKPNRHR